MKTLGHNSLMILIIILVVFSSSSFSPRCEALFQWSTGVEVHVMNALLSSSPILVRCQSKNDDLGYHTLAVYDEFRWNFKSHVFSRTLFFCHFYLDAEQKESVFDTYTEDLALDHCGNYPDKNHYRCYWLAREDGFYLGPDLNHTSAFVKLNEWQKRV
ncbi:hypothetical protein DM860_011302 [Cuscuta australis]|uniref:S-protein homolog n=1 Tax=Cuscuta australis TaxID=267555 RepID=A0A328DPM4_9ASTE|nr:hypothetical protein DM860_011302 [Cuscuta australis]